VSGPARRRPLGRIRIPRSGDPTGETAPGRHSVTPEPQIPDQPRTPHEQPQQENPERNSSVQKRSTTIGRAWRLIAAAASGALVAGVSATPAFAAVTVTPASGGTSFTAANAGPSATYTNLGAIVVDEANAQEISTGRFSIMAPAGFEFRTTSTVQVTLSGPNQSWRPSISASASCTGSTRSTLNVTPTTTALTFYVCDRSDVSSVLTVGLNSGTTNRLGVRPTASTPVASGNMYLDGATGAVTVSGVTRGVGGTNFGTLVQNPGAASQLSVSLPASSTAGVAQSATVTARDSFGNVATGYRGAVAFTSTDAAATKPGDYTFTAADNGVHTFPGVVFKTAGTRNLAATDKATSSVTGTASTSVVAASAVSLTLSGIASPTTAGAGASATVTVRDAYGNLATGFTGTVGFTSTDPAATLPADYTFSATDAGTHVFTGGVTLRTAGNQGVTATSGALSSTQSPIAVQPGTLAALVLSPATSTMDAGASRSYTAQGRDASGNNLGDLTAGTTFSISPDGSCTGNVCTATVAGPHTVTATRSGATGTAALQVNPATPVVTVGLAPATVVADGTATTAVTVHVVDQYGNARPNDTLTLSTDGGAVLGAVHNNGDGTYSATLTASTVAGTQTITATTGSVTGSAVLTQVAGPVAALTLTLSAPSVTADGVSTVDATVTATDLYGNPKAGEALALATDGDVAVSAVTDRGFGVYTATVTASATAGTEKLTATIGSVSTSVNLTELASLTVSTVSPATRGQGANGGAFGQSVTITGTGFTPGALTSFGDGVTVKFTTVVDATTLIAHIVVAGNAPVGSRDVTVTLPDGRSATCAACFTVVPGPQVTGVSPNAIGPGAQRTIVVTGANFASGIKVTVPASGVAVTSVAVLSTTQLSVGLSTAGAAAPGPRDLILTNPGDAGSTTCAGCFEVSAAPVVGEVSPSVLGGGALATVTVTGANFSAGARVSFAGSGVAVLSQSRVDENTIVATLSVAGAAVAGDRTVTVINADGGKGASATAFAVSGAPRVTGITPSMVSRGGSAQVTITGTNFVPGATVSLSTGVTLTDVEVVDANTITATVSVAANTGAGNRTVLVTNPDFGKGTCGGCFRVL
jgi:hypothetical protein